MYSNCGVTSFKHVWFIYKNIEVFNEMEISVINNFHKILSKNKSKRKRNFIYHFPVKSKPHERIDLLIITRVNIYQTKTYIS